MTHDLFAEMDRRAAFQREQPLWVPEDDKIAFRQLQKEHMPALSDETFLDLFDVWRLHNLGSLEIEIEQLRGRLVALEQARWKLLIHVGLVDDIPVELGEIAREISRAVIRQRDLGRIHKGLCVAGGTAAELSP